MEPTQNEQIAALIRQIEQLGGRIHFRPDNVFTIQAPVGTEESVIHQLKYITHKLITAIQSAETATHEEA